MSSSSDFAQVADLLGDTGGQKEIVLKTRAGKRVTIQKANVGILSDIMKVSGENPLEQFIWLTFKCVTRPKMKLEEVKRLPHSVLIEIGTHIAQFSGLDRSSITDMQNLLGVELLGPSS